MRARVCGWPCFPWRAAPPCQRLTCALAHPPLCCDGVTSARSILKYTCINVSAIASAKNAGAGVWDCPAPPRLHFFTSAPFPVAIIRCLFAPPRTQQCHKNGIIVAQMFAAPVSAPLAPAVGGTAQHDSALRSSELSSADRLLVGVRAPRGCPLAHTRT